jgi:Ca2+-binding EF-hand superfamily protein
MSLQLAASTEKVFCSLDTDGNGFLDRDELKAGFASMVYIQNSNLCRHIIGSLLMIFFPPKN